MISTRNLSELPSIDALRRMTQSLAILEAIIERNWEARYYSFNKHWSTGEQLASMRNGEGDEWFCVFTDQGAFLKGFDHEARMAPANNGAGKVWPGVLDSVPEPFQPFLTEPAFSMAQTTFCIWQLNRDLRWQRGTISFPENDDPDGSASLLAIFDGNPRTYQQWAEGYYDRPVSLSAVEHIYAYNPLTDDIVSDLNSDVSLSMLADDIAEIGYPTD